MTGVTSGLRDLLGRLVAYRVDWANRHPGQDYEADANRERVESLADASVVSSELAEFYPDLSANENVDLFKDFLSIETSSQRHIVAIDVDHPTHVVESSTPGHFHLYIDVPGGIEHEAYMDLLDALAHAGVIEEGYAKVSRSRGATDLRPPWVKKDDEPAPTLRCCRCRKRPPELLEYRTLAAEIAEVDIDSLSDAAIDDFARKNEGTLDPKTGLFACTACYLALGCPSSEFGWTPTGLLDPPKEDS